MKDTNILILIFIVLMATMFTIYYTADILTAQDTKPFIERMPFYEQLPESQLTFYSCRFDGINQTECTVTYKLPAGVK